MQSLDYPGYKDSTELDMLAHLLTRHRLADVILDEPFNVLIVIKTILTI